MENVHDNIGVIEEHPLSFAFAFRMPHAFALFLKLTGDMPGYTLHVPVGRARGDDKIPGEVGKLPNVQNNDAFGFLIFAGFLNRLRNSSGLHFF